jgi:hypothetical protein
VPRRKTGGDQLDEQIEGQAVRRHDGLSRAISRVVEREWAATVRSVSAPNDFSSPP